MDFSIKNLGGIEDAIKQMLKSGRKVPVVGRGEEQGTLMPAGEFNNRIIDERMGRKERGE